MSNQFREIDPENILRISLPNMTNPTDKRHDTDDSIIVNNLSKRYSNDGEEIEALANISFSVKKGSIVGILGPNGAGKTTLIKSMLGLIIPSAGSIRINGNDPTINQREVYREVCGTLEGARNTYWRLTVKQNLEFFASLNDIHPYEIQAQITEVLDTFDLTSKMDERVNNLSRGMKQKVGLACALIQNGSVIFLDEPTLGLDIESSISLCENLRTIAETEGITIILTSHDMDVIENLCDRVIILQDGLIVADDTVENLKTLFNVQTYKISLADTPSKHSLAKLEARFHLTSYNTYGGQQFEFDVNLENSDQFYELISILSTTNCSIVGIRSVDPNLESIYIELTENARLSRNAGSVLVGDSVK